MLTWSECQESDLKWIRRNCNILVSFVTMWEVDVESGLLPWYMDFLPYFLGSLQWFLTHKHRCCCVERPESDGLWNNLHVRCAAQAQDLLCSIAYIILEAELRNFSSMTRNTRAGRAVDFTLKKPLKTQMLAWLTGEQDRVVAQYKKGSNSFTYCSNATHLPMLQRPPCYLVGPISFA